MRLFAPGDRVAHDQYGPGTVSSTDEQYTVIEFDQHGRKMFVTHMVSLEPSSEPAPEPAAGSRKGRGTRKSRAKKSASS